MKASELKTGTVIQVEVLDEIVSRRLAPAYYVDDEGAATEQYPKGLGPTVPVNRHDGVSATPARLRDQQIGRHGQIIADCHPPGLDRHALVLRRAQPLYRPRCGWRYVVEQFRELRATRFPPFLRRSGKPAERDGPAPRRLEGA